MTQNASDVEIANQGFAAFRQDLNDVLEDITTLHSGTAAPSTTYANQWWYETDTDKLYIRNEDNDAWIEILTLDQANDKIASLDLQGGELILDDDGDTSITADTDDQIDFKVGGSNVAYVNTSGIGIGTVPASNVAIDVRTNATTNSVDIRNTDSGGFGLYTAAGSTSSHYALRAADSSNNLLFTVQSDGNVGIGTSSPDTKIHVEESGAADLIARVENTNAGGYAAIFHAKSNGNFNFTRYEGSAKKWLVGQRGLSGGQFSIYDEDNAAHRMSISATGDVTITGDSNAGYLGVPQAYAGTTTSAANLHILSSGVFLRSTSSGRYKTGVEDAEMSYAEELYNLRPVYYKSLGTFDNPNHGHWGFIAEEVAEIDPRLCFFKTTEPDLDDDGNIQHDDDGNIVETTLDEPVVEGVQYDRMIPLLLMLLKTEKDKVETLETQNADFETRIAALESA